VQITLSLHTFSIQMKFYDPAKLVSRWHGNTTLCSGILALSLREGSKAKRLKDWPRVVDILHPGVL
jgi:hypothetical protein